MKLDCSALNIVSISWTLDGGLIFPWSEIHSYLVPVF